MSEQKMCKKCGAVMDKNAKACPQCGAPAKGKKGWIIGVIAALIVIGAAAGGSNNDSGSTPVSTTSIVSQNEVSSAETGSQETESVQPQEETLSTAEESKVEESKSEEGKPAEAQRKSEESKSESKEESTSNVFHIGETLDTGKVKITFQSAEDYVSDNMFIEPEAGKKFIRTYFIVENTSSADVYVSSYDFQCYADNAVADTPLLSDNLLSADAISAGRKTEGYVYYEIPENAQSVEIEYETSFWTQKKAIFVVK